MEQAGAAKRLAENSSANIAREHTTFEDIKSKLSEMRDLASNLPNDDGKSWVLGQLEEIRSVVDSVVLRQEMWKTELESDQD
jgi:hypothetical protein